MSSIGEGEIKKFAFTTEEDLGQQFTSCLGKNKSIHLHVCEPSVNSLLSYIGILLLALSTKAMIMCLDSL